MLVKQSLVGRDRAERSAAEASRNRFMLLCSMIRAAVEARLKLTLRGVNRPER